METGLVGRTLAHYRILRELGSGGMGRVYVAEDSRLGREVALKVLPPELAASPERLLRFEREARALASLSHPGIVTIYSVEEAEGVHFLTMELVSGRTLTELLAGGALPVGQVVELGLALAEALGAAHGRGAEAIRAGERSVELCPVSRDALEGPVFLQDLAEIHARVGDPEVALALPGELLAIPSNLSPAMLRLDPAWDPPRANPRFRALAGTSSPSQRGGETCGLGCLSAQQCGSASSSAQPNCHQRDA